MKYIYSYIPFQDDFFTSVYSKNNFIQLATTSISRIKNFGKVIIYTTKDLIPFFQENIDKNILYKEVEYSRTFHWTKQRYISIIKEIESDEQPLIHIDFDMFFLRDCFSNEDEIPNLFISHGEYHNSTGKQIMENKKIPSAGPLLFYDELFMFLKNKNFPKEILDFNVNFSYNTGIFGGKNLSLIKDICSEILYFENKYNYLFLDLISKKEFSNPLLYTPIMDQALMAAILEKRNITPVPIDVMKINVLHFASDAKQSPIFREKLNDFYINHLNDKNFDIKKHFAGTF